MKTHSATTADATNSPVNNRQFPSTLLQTHCLHSFSMTTEIKASMPARVVVYKVLHSGPKPSPPLESNRDWFPKSKKDQFCNLPSIGQMCIFKALKKQNKTKKKLYTFKIWAICSRSSMRVSVQGTASVGLGISTGSRCAC